VIELLVAVLLASPTSEYPTPPPPIVTIEWGRTSVDCAQGLVFGLETTYHSTAELVEDVWVYGDPVPVETHATERPAFGEDCAVALPTHALPNTLAETGPVTGWLLPVGLAMLGAGVILNRRRVV
jgi:hypothetical protein